jgi:hypothetical protein
LYCGFFGSEAEQGFDGFSGSVQGFGFDALGHVEQHHDHSRFAILADDYRPGHGHGHERVDVQIAVPDCQPAFAVGAQAREQDGEQGEDQGQMLGRAGRQDAPFPPFGHELEAFRSKGEEARHYQPGPGSPGFGGTARAGTGAERGRFGHKGSLGSA